MVTQQPDLSEDQLVPQLCHRLWWELSWALSNCCTFARPLFML